MVYYNLGQELAVLHEFNRSLRPRCHCVVPSFGNRWIQPANARSFDKHSPMDFSFDGELFFTMLDEITRLAQNGALDPRACSGFVHEEVERFPCSDLDREGRGKE